MKIYYSINLAKDQSDGWRPVLALLFTSFVLVHSQHRAMPIAEKMNQLSLEWYFLLVIHRSISSVLSGIGFVLCGADSGELQRDRHCLCSLKHGYCPLLILLARFCEPHSLNSGLPYLWDELLKSRRMKSFLSWEQRGLISDHEIYNVRKPEFAIISESSPFYLIHKYSIQAIYLKCH